MAMFAKEQSFFIDGETDKTIVSSFSTSTSALLLPYRKKNLNISLMANLLNLNSAHYNIFRYVSMTVYMIEIEKNSLIFNSVIVTILSQVTKLNVYFHPVG